mgnify:CR=1 FL=1
MENRELLAQRIVDIITKLNVGEILDIDELANVFGVSKRTIQRDINSRLAFLPLERNGSKVSLNANSLGKLTHHDIKNFAQLSGVSDLYPQLDSHFVTNLLTNAYKSPYLVTGNEFEHDKVIITQNIKKLESAISKTKFITFQYKDKSYNAIAPYKLINHNQVWYVAAVDNNKLKTFHFYTETPAVFELEPKEKIEVVLKVSPEVAHYFKRRQLLPEQVIDKELENGELIISSEISYDLQIVPLIKYWMPHLQVITPIEIHEQVIADIERYQLIK